MKLIVILEANWIPSWLTPWRVACAFWHILHFVCIYIYMGWGGVGWDINVLTITSLIIWWQRMFHQLGRPWWCNMMLCWQYVGLGWVWGGILTSSRSRPWYYGVNACSTNWDDLDDAHDAALTVRWGVGWGGVGVGYQRPHDVRPWYYVVNACSTNWDDLDGATWCDMVLVFSCMQPAAVLQIKNVILWHYSCFLTKVCLGRVCIIDNVKGKKMRNVVK